MTVGYVRHKTIGLTFDGDMADLEVTMRVMSIDTWMELCALTAGGLDFIPDNIERIDRYREILIEHAESWSLEEPAGTPVPFNMEKFKAQDKDFQAAIMNAWADQVVAVPVPLGEPSTGGPPVPLAEIPMDLPASQAS